MKFTRRAWLGFLLAIALAVACGESGPEMGTAIFRVDPNTCTGSGQLELFLDGESLGTFTLSTGASRSFQVSAGPHTFGGRETKPGGFVFQTINGVVPADGSFTYLMVCQ